MGIHEGGGGRSFVSSRLMADGLRTEGVSEDNVGGQGVGAEHPVWEARLYCVPSLKFSRWCLPIGSFGSAGFYLRSELPRVAPPGRVGEAGRNPLPFAAGLGFSKSVVNSAARKGAPQ